MNYCISCDYLEKVEDCQSIADILFTFPNSYNSHKIVFDRNMQIISIYKSIINNRPENIKNYLSDWINFVGFTTNTIQYIDVDLSTIIENNEKFHKLCSMINGARKLIIYSCQDYPFHINTNNQINYGGTLIDILDKDSAAYELNFRPNVINNSIVAGGNISNANNNINQ